MNVEIRIFTCNVSYVMYDKLPENVQEVRFSLY